MNSLDEFESYKFVFSSKVEMANKDLAEGDARIQARFDRIVEIRSKNKACKRGTYGIKLCFYQFQ